MHFYHNFEKRPKKTLAVAEFREFIMEHFVQNNVE